MYSHTTLAMELDIAADLQKLWESSAGVADHPGSGMSPVLGVRSAVRVS
ncbi:hypothetical protein [Streptomyces sp. NBC_00847]|nr:hypothetical protein [Streptomyces sp. NBC_00847]MCX4878902.1 hypothetical protein [Streptomyces sp. NBC_00847]